ncbi:MAG: hypothetical protein DSM106950_42035 [Stigonema ocellatum SAG 48.90 = DSM 106950]|nr:hypothetical protein [Stigonema ocellatum SAG 48.90 = DSM 106950]
MIIVLEHPNKESWSAEIREDLGYPIEFDTFIKPKTDACYSQTSISENI